MLVHKFTLSFTTSNASYLLIFLLFVTLVERLGGGSVLVSTISFVPRARG